MKQFFIFMNISYAYIYENEKLPPMAQSERGMSRSGRVTSPQFEAPGINITPYFPSASSNAAASASSSTTGGSMYGQTRIFLMQPQSVTGDTGRKASSSRCAQSNHAP